MAKIPYSDDRQAIGDYRGRDSPADFRPPDILQGGGQFGDGRSGSQRVASVGRPL